MVPHKTPAAFCEEPLEVWLGGGTWLSGIAL
jgi:hypothetical protein